MGDFDSAWWKWRWAVGHSQRLITEVEAWAADLRRDPMATVKAKYHPKRHGFSVVIDTVEDFPTPLSLRLGDFVSNQRQCLDHVAWAMVQRGSRADSLTKGQASGVQFPYARNAEHFQDLIPRRLRGACRADVNVVRRFQPYQRKVYRETLGNLATFSNYDKHRTIKEILILPIAASVHVSNPRDCEVVVVRKPAGRPRALDVGTEVAFVEVKKRGPDPGIDVDGKSTIQTQFGITDRLMLDNWWAVTCQIVCNLLATLAEAPFAFDDLPDWSLPPRGFHGARPG